MGTGGCLVKQQWLEPSRHLTRVKLFRGNAFQQFFALKAKRRSRAEVSKAKPRDTHKRTGLCWATAEQLWRSTLTIVAQLWRKFSFEPESFNLGQAKRQV